MPKTIDSMIHDSEVRENLWRGIASDPLALADRGKTELDALFLVEYFEGKKDAFIEAKRINANDNQQVPLSDSSDG